jgi:hypothetical protein
VVGVVRRGRGRFCLGVRHGESFRWGREVWCRKGSLVGSREEKFLMIFQGSTKIVLIPNRNVNYCSKCQM